MMEILKNSGLFKDIDEADILSLLECLGGRRLCFEKGEFILLSGQSKPVVAILLWGKAQVVKENILGDSMLIGLLGPGDMFGETFACMGLERMPVSVAALEDSGALMLDVERIVNPCGEACGYHRQLISNLLRIVAEKNALLNKKMSFISHKTIRGRLEAYFHDMIEAGGSYEFYIPFNRNELADYLCADRSALSRELSRMRREGIVEYSGRRFEWLPK